MSDNPRTFTVRAVPPPSAPPPIFTPEAIRDAVVKLNAGPPMIGTIGGGEPACRILPTAKEVNGNLVIEVEILPTWAGAVVFAALNGHLNTKNDAAEP